MNAIIARETVASINQTGSWRRHKPKRKNNEKATNGYSFASIRIRGSGCAASVKVAALLQMPLIHPAK
jgi:hypothetical protein